MKLGIIDWGIGGISVYKLIKESLGDVPTIYFSDTGATPYGKMSHDELVARLNKVIEFLKSNGVTHLVIGCNAASTAIPFLNDENLQIEGVIENAVKMTAKLKPAKLALIGGRRTVLSGIYRRKFATRNIKVSQRIAQPLSALIESGDVSSETLKAECRKILAPIKNCSHLLLACTHYPAIIPVLKEIVSVETIFVDPAGELVKKVSAWQIPHGETVRFLTTGDGEAMKKAAQNAFDFKIEKIEQTII